MKVRLTVKLADVVDGIDLTHCAEGDVIELAARDARLLVAEGWAELADDGAPVTCEASGAIDPRAVAADDLCTTMGGLDRNSPENLFEPTVTAVELVVPVRSEAVVTRTTRETA